MSWHHHITSWDEPVVYEVGPTGKAIYGRRYMILNQAGQVMGYTSLATKRWGSDPVVFALQLDAEITWLATAPGLLRGLSAYRQQVPAIGESDKPVNAIFFNLGRSHPLFDIMRYAVPMREEQPYARYVRVRAMPRCCATERRFWRRDWRNRS